MKYHETFHFNFVVFYRHFAVLQQYKTLHGAVQKSALVSKQEILGFDQDFVEVKKFYCGKKEDKYFTTKTQLRKKSCWKWLSDTKRKEKTKLWL